MQFTKKLHGGIRAGDITTSIRIWKQPRVKVGGRYRLGDGEIEVDSMTLVDLEDVTPRMARESGFEDVADLLETARHGRGENVFLVRFHYIPAPGG